MSPLTDFSYEQFDLSDIKTYPLDARRSKARVADFARPVAQGSPIGALVDSLPSILAAGDFKTVVKTMVDAKRNRDGILWGLGGHVIKTGVGPILIDLMERGFVSAIAANGAAMIHDFEIALIGATSEDVDEALGPGRFGMADETGRILNEVINQGADEGLGIGQSVCRYFRTDGAGAPFSHASVLASAARLDIPVTIHVAIGTDIIHMHPAASGASLGDAAIRDFRYFTTNVSRLERGVYLNCGSAVVMPEVFLKAIALSRNRGIKFAGLTTVNLDFMRMYRAMTNVVSRPTVTSKRGYSLVGHHEIMIPLLAAAVIESDANRQSAS